MFNLELAIHQWCVQVLASHALNTEKLAELKDHLYCEIEEQVAQGKSEQQAFNQAINSIGDAENLKAQFDINRSFFDKLCAKDYGTLGEFYHDSEAGERLLKIHKKLQISQAILWAAALLASALIVKDNKEQAFNVTMLLVVLSTISLGSLKSIFKR